MTPTTFDTRHRRTAAALAGLAAALACTTVLLGDSRASDGHRIYLEVPEAESLAVGQQVRAAGTPVGKIASLDLAPGGRTARVGLDLQGDAWPLGRRTKAELRWGGTVSALNRYVALRRDPRGPHLGEGDTLPRANVAPSVGYDTLISTFTAATRRDLKALVNRSGAGLLAARPHLREALANAPGTLEQGSTLLRDLSANRAGLTTLLRSTDGVVDAVQRGDAGLRRVLTGAAATLSAIGSEERALRASLDAAPGTLRQVNATLQRANPTLAAAGRLTDRLAPGARAARTLVEPLDDTLAELIAVGPSARSTLRSVTRGGPDITSLLGRLEARAPQLKSILGQADHELNCIRPYTPEIAAFASNWGDFLSPVDARDHFLRANVQFLAPTPANVLPMDSGDVSKLTGLRFAFPRPPGYNAGQSWFLPECGAGEDALDPEKDPEARSFAQNMQLPNPPSRGSRRP